MKWSYEKELIKQIDHKTNRDNKLNKFLLNNLGMIQGP